MWIARTLAIGVSLFLATFALDAWDPQRRVAELSSTADSPEKDRELEELAEAMLAWELRCDEAME